MFFGVDAKQHIYQNNINICMVPDLPNSFFDGIYSIDAIFRVVVSKWVVSLTSPPKLTTAGHHIFFVCFFPFRIDKFF